MNGSHTLFSLFAAAVMSGMSGGLGGWLTPRMAPDTSGDSSGGVGPLTSRVATTGPIHEDGPLTARLAQPPPASTYRTLTPNGVMLRPPTVPVDNYFAGESRDGSSGEDKGSEKGLSDVEEEETTWDDWTDEGCPWKDANTLARKVFFLQLAVNSLKGPLRDLEATTSPLQKKAVTNIWSFIRADLDLLKTGCASMVLFTCGLSRRFREAVTQGPATGSSRTLLAKQELTSFRWQGHLYMRGGIQRIWKRYWAGVGLHFIALYLKRDDDHPAFVVSLTGCTLHDAEKDTRRPFSFSVHPVVGAASFFSAVSQRVRDQIMREARAAAEGKPLAKAPTFLQKQSSQNVLGEVRPVVPPIRIKETSTPSRPNIQDKADDKDASLDDDDASLDDTVEVVPRASSVSPRRSRPLAVCPDDILSMRSPRSTEEELCYFRVHLPDGRSEMVTGLPTMTLEGLMTQLIHERGAHVDPDKYGFKAERPISPTPTGQEKKSGEFLNPHMTLNRVTSSDLFIRPRSRLDVCRVS